MEDNHYWIFEDADEYGYTYRCPVCNKGIIAHKKFNLPAYCIFCNTMLKVNKNDEKDT